MTRLEKLEVGHVKIQFKFHRLGLILLHLKVDLKIEMN
jgi:hypothetical protein